MAKNFWENDEEVKFNPQDEEVGSFQEIPDTGVITKPPEYKIGNMTVPYKAVEAIDLMRKLYGAKPIAEMIESEKNASVLEKAKNVAKESGVAVARTAPFAIAPEAGFIRAGLTTAGSSLAENVLKGDSYSDASKKAAISGLLGGTLQKGMQLIGKAAAPATGFALGVKTPIAQRVVQKPELLEEGGESGFSGFAKDYTKTLKSLINKAGERVSEIKKQLPKDEIINISDDINGIKDIYKGTNVDDVANDIISFANRQHSKVPPENIKKVFGVQPKSKFPIKLKPNEPYSGEFPSVGNTNPKNIEKPLDLSYQEAQDVRDLLGDFTSFGENLGKPKEIAEQVRKSIGHKIDSIDERFMPAQETYAKTQDLVSRARKGAGIPEDAVKFADTKGRAGVFELPPDFSESGIRNLGQELLLASGKKEPQANILKLVEERAGIPLQERLKDITARIAVQEAKERPLGILSATGAGSAAGMAESNPLVSTGIIAPIIARTTFQKNPQALAAIIRGMKKISPVARQGPRAIQGVTQSILQNIMGGER